MESWDAEAVRERLGRLAELDPGCERFGARTHRYVLRPPLPEAEIRRFEETHGIALPEAYRSFVATVGDGPAGPAYGLMPLTVPRAEVGDDWAVDDEWREDRRPGRLATPFPLAEPLPGRISADRADALVPGTLLLAEEGCGIYVRLVLNGPRTGEVWQLDPDWAGFVPLAADFRAWYTLWLDSSGHSA